MSANLKLAFCVAVVKNRCLYVLGYFCFCLSSDLMELQRAKEHNEKLDAETRALRERVRTLESEKKTLLVSNCTDALVRI